VSSDFFEFCRVYVFLNLHARQFQSSGPATEKKIENVKKNYLKSLQFLWS